MAGYLPRGIAVIRIGGYPISAVATLTPETRRQALRRIKIIAGQVAALERQLDEDRYCMDILDLSFSVQKALRSLDNLVLDGHLRTHVVEMMKGGNEEKAIDELRRLYRLQGPAE